MAWMVAYENPDQRFACVNAGAIEHTLARCNRQRGRSDLRLRTYCQRRLKLDPLAAGEN